MTQAIEGDTNTAPDSAPNGYEGALASLRQQGAHRSKPVDFHYMEALARRANDQTPRVQQILEGKLARAVAAYQAELGQTQSDAGNALGSATALAPTLLGQLVSAMAQHTPQSVSNSWTPPNSSRTELKSVRNFRDTWSKLSAQKQVSQALGQAPKNAGPINSHMLVLRSLELMRDISPDYLNRFMSYADTLLCLDQIDLSAKPRQAKPLAPTKPRPRAPARP